VAYDLVPLANTHPGVGAGLVGRTGQRWKKKLFWDALRKFGLCRGRHTRLTGRAGQKGGCLRRSAGSFLISNALASGANFYITSDVKYHEFFDANDRLVIADIGHFESEQFTTTCCLRFCGKNFVILRSLNRMSKPIRFITIPVLGKRPGRR
jgi:hypothetical protein